MLWREEKTIINCSPQLWAVNILQVFLSAIPTKSHIVVVVVWKKSAFHIFFSIPHEYVHDSHTHSYTCDFFFVFETSKKNVKCYDFPCVLFSTQPSLFGFENEGKKFSPRCGCMSECVSA
jgi:hypothetical protein